MFILLALIVIVVVCGLLVYKRRKLYRNLADKQGSVSSIKEEGNVQTNYDIIGNTNQPVFYSFSSIQIFKSADL